MRCAIMSIAQSLGLAGKEWLGESGYGMAGLGMARCGRLGKVLLVVASYGAFRHVMAGLGEAWFGRRRGPRGCAVSRSLAVIA